ncbi:MAG: TMEM175 family protein [Rhodoferax sp.]|nr:TMEM175 family protein [Rhodoferax sp.]
MPHKPSQILYPRVRLEALSDGIFAVAMTLLVLDIRLPDDFHPARASDLLQGLLDLLPKVCLT